MSPDSTTIDTTTESIDFLYANQNQNNQSAVITPVDHLPRPVSWHKYLLRQRLRMICQRWKWRDGRGRQMHEEMDEWMDRWIEDWMKEWLINLFLNQFFYPNLISNTFECAVLQPPSGRFGRRPSSSSSSGSCGGSICIHDRLQYWLRRSLGPTKHNQRPSAAPGALWRHSNDINCMTTWQWYVINMTMICHWHDYDMMNDVTIAW